MASCRSVKMRGFSFNICVGVVGLICFSPNLEDETTLQALRTQDTHLFEAMAYLAQDPELVGAAQVLDEIDPAYNCKWVRYEYWARKVLDSPFASVQSRENARTALSEVQKHRAKVAAREAKRGLVKKRRQEFNGSRATAMLALIERDSHQCAKCEAVDDLTIDHIVPISRGGTDDLGNLRLLCRSCNSRKGDRIEH